MQTIAVTGVSRDDVGKKATKAVRKAGLIPCVVYGGETPNHFSVKHNDVKKLIYTPEFKLAEVTVGGSTQKCIIKKVDFHPVTDSIVHIDFLRLIDGHKLNVEVPVRFSGVSPGVKGGGKLQQAIRRVKLKTTPENLVDFVEVDISHLELGMAVRIRDIKPVDGVEVMNPSGTPIATVEVPRALKSAEAAAAAEAAPAAEGAEAEGGAEE